jgi:hypothetical protein
MILRGSTGSLKGRSRVSAQGGNGDKCSECNKYSRNTFFCAKLRKVLDKDKEACTFFASRRMLRKKRARKY